MPCPEVRVGRVEIPGENYARIQSEVDQGRHLWRLSPVRTTQVVGTKHFGLRTNDSYTFVEQYYDPGSGLNYAVVRVQHKSCLYSVELYQPEKQGTKGVWVVHEITPI